MPGSFIRRARKRFGLTVADLARSAGLDAAELDAFEQGRLELASERADALTRALVAAIEPLAAPATGLDDPGLIARQREMPMGARLESGFALSRFASQLAGAARR
jgi:transcriptional regulator with XRE-family HTH domain